MRNTLADFFRWHWANLIAFVIFLLPVGRYVIEARWLDLLALPVFGFMGLIFFIANELVSEAMPEVPHMRFEGFGTFQSPLLVKIGGAVMLLVAAYGAFVIV
ncbi:MAG: hypothetical protein ACKVT0_02100 [Planctomycetaceae bacterium]